MPKSYHHVTLDIRSQIYALKSIGTTLHKIGKQVGFHVSTISREIKRNADGKSYDYKYANSISIERRTKASCGNKKFSPETFRIIDAKILEAWSPEQISGRLKLEGINISHESIYQYIWEDKHSGGILYKYLRHHGKKYNKRSSGAHSTMKCNIDYKLSKS